MLSLNIFITYNLHSIFFRGLSFSENLKNKARAPFKDRSAWTLKVVLMSEELEGKPNTLI